MNQYHRREVKPVAKAKAKRNERERERFTFSELDRLQDALSRPSSDNVVLIEKLERMYDDAVEDDN